MIINHYNASGFRHYNHYNLRFWIPWSGVDLPAFVLWWNGLGAVLDLTNLEARAWYESQLGHLKSEYRIDSFKFDGGESSWLSSLGHPSNSLDNINDYTRYFTDVAHHSDVQLRMQEVIIIKVVLNWLKLIDLFP